MKLSIVILPILATITLAMPEPKAIADPLPEASPGEVIAMKVCRRVLACGDRKGVCVDTSKPNACVGGQLFKSDCGSEGYCCILEVSISFPFRGYNHTAHYTH